MDLYEYQEKARSTAIYLKIENSKILYPSLGLIGECGEVAEKIKKLIRDDSWDMNDDSWDMNEDRKKAIKQELGDCCWYLANICCDIDNDLGMIYEMRGASIMHQIRGLILPRLVIHMNRYATAVVESLERWYYIYESRANERGRFNEIPQHISHIITCIEEIARRCDFTLKEVCAANIEKLSDRQKRNVLKGEGDNR